VSIDVVSGTILRGCDIRRERSNSLASDARHNLTEIAGAVSAGRSESPVPGRLFGHPKQRRCGCQDHPRSGQRGLGSARVRFPDVASDTRSNAAAAAKITPGLGSEEDGRSAIEILRCETFDALIVDVYLPILDGPQVISQVG
jgi:hypothetical protein